MQNMQATQAMQNTTAPTLQASSPALSSLTEQASALDDLVCQVEVLVRQFSQINMDLQGGPPVQVEQEKSLKSPEAPDHFSMQQNSLNRLSSSVSDLSELVSAIGKCIGR